MNRGDIVKDRDCPSWGRGTVMEVSEVWILVQFDGRGSYRGNAWYHVGDTAEKLKVVG